MCLKSSFFMDGYYSFLIQWNCFSNEPSSFSIVSIVILGKKNLLNQNQLVGKFLSFCGENFFFVKTLNRVKISRFILHRTMVKILR